MSLSPSLGPSITSLQQLTKEATVPPFPIPSRLHMSPWAPRHIFSPPRDSRRETREHVLALRHPEHNTLGQRWPG